MFTIIALNDIIVSVLYAKFYKKGMIYLEKRRRYDVYRPSVHGRKWIGASNILERAMSIGQEYGCTELGCPCGMYEIYDNKLKTNNITYMIKDVMKREKRRNQQFI